MFLSCLYCDNLSTKTQSQLYLFSVSVEGWHFVRGVESVDKNTVIDAALEFSVMHHGKNTLCKLLFVLMFIAFIPTAAFLVTFSYLH